MTGEDWVIPPSVLHQLDRLPSDRPVVALLRHSVRDHLPPGDAGYVLPITEGGRRLAIALGSRLRGRLRTLHASPLVRCLQTAEALNEGAQSDLVVIPNRLLGDPGVFVLEGGTARSHWERLGHEQVMRHLVTESAALSGMARPDEAARYLVQSMLGTAAGQPGIHLFITHDSVVTATAARLIGKPLGVEDWPWYLEAAFFWDGPEGVHVAYREHAGVHPRPLCSFDDHDLVEFARREVAATIGLDTGAHFFLAGGAFKTLLTGVAPRDLDLWAASEKDRSALLNAVQRRGARSAGPRPFADAFELSGRLIEIPHSSESTSLTALLERFDIGLSAVGVEHRPSEGWSAFAHPLALDSVRRREVLLLKPLVNWKYALTTLERMRRYAVELGFSVPAEEEAEIWRVFETQTAAERAAMVRRYRNTGSGAFGILDEAARRSI